MSEFMRQFLFRIVFLKFNYMLHYKKGQKLQKTYVGKAGTIAKKEFGNFETMLFRENSEKLKPQIWKNWSRPINVFFYCNTSSIALALYMLKIKIK